MTNSLPASERLGRSAAAVPMLATIIVPPTVFRMSRRETVAYLVLTFLSSPVIHVLFSFLVGWKDYLPFIDIPAFWEL